MLVIVWHIHDVISVRKFSSLLAGELKSFEPSSSSLFCGCDSCQRRVRHLHHQSTDRYLINRTYSLHATAPPLPCIPVVWPHQMLFPIYHVWTDSLCHFCCLHVTTTVPRIAKNSVMIHLDMPYPRPSQQSDCVYQHHCHSTSSHTDVQQHQCRHSRTRRKSNLSCVCYLFNAPV